uniref:VLRF1 domain-containing protein n=1 Tax=Chromera velia CCMP2878 TaxID=1169474 RepID=A0A0G4IDU0_9ALVE|eukprot:Cvel_13521.t1-p1 / transcript=Cvel_13521.t1 / gene=Cvel_13521 / organism=Chromera_velia_CCMP2878 / gene_product=hypothetical protein / transcript_product=hypothetical protein / location=Cvel_scaffold927:40873-45294(-) / protein_length=732 / sequence_SO=supercontig / SO=protein_coding / is_pseudo=false
MASLERQQIVEGLQRTKAVQVHRDGTFSFSLFSIPRAFFEEAGVEEAERREAAEAPVVVPSPERGAPVEGFVCSKCPGSSFPTQADLRLHFKTEWHVTNVRRLVKGSEGLSEAQWHEALQELDAQNGDGDGEEGGEVIEEEDSESSEETAKSSSESEEDTKNGPAGRRASEPPSVDAGALRVLVCRGLFRKEDLRDRERGYDTQWILSQLKFCWQNRKWAIVMLRSGRFAAAVFEGPTVLVHRVVVRYTVRRKAGGSQAACDSSGKKPKSAGAALRRENEKRLLEQSRDTLNREWYDLVARCGLIFLSCSRRLEPVLLSAGPEKERDPKKHPVHLPPQQQQQPSKGGGETEGGDETAVRKCPVGSSSESDRPVFARSDPRLRFLPFATGRPTFEEVKRVHTLLVQATAVPVSVFEEQFRAPAASTEGPRQKAGEERGRQIEREAGGDAQRGRGEGAENRERAAEAVVVPVPPLVKVLCEISDPTVRVGALRRLLVGTAEETEREGASAASAGEGRAGLERQIQEALDSLFNGREGDGSPASVLAGEGLPGGVDMADAEGLTALHWAAQLGLSDETRELLRAGASVVSKDHRGRLPFFLAEQAKAREAFRRARGELGEEAQDWEGGRVPEAITEDSEAKRRDKEREKRKRAKERQKEKKEQAKVEAEEKKKREEEERIRAENAKKCDACGKPILGKPFYRLEFKYCTTDCVHNHRRVLMAEAAEKRQNQGGAI